MSLLGYTKVIPYTKFEHFGSFVFELCCGQTDKQTDKLTNRRHRTLPTALPTPTDVVGVSNNLYTLLQMKLYFSADRMIWVMSLGLSRGSVIEIHGVTVINSANKVGEV